MTRVSGSIKAAALVFGALFVGLVACELFLRAASPIYTTGIQDAYEYDSALGVRLRRSIDLRRITDHREEIHSNQLGTANFQTTFDGYGGLVFALGDSYTQGTGVPEDESYPLQLDLLLNQNADQKYIKNFAVVNLGLAAFGAEQTLGVLNRYSRMIGPPKACLFFGSDNDFDDDLLFRSGARHRHLVRGNPKWMAFTPFLVWLGNRQLAIRAKMMIAERRLARLRNDFRATSAPPATNLARTKLETVAEREWPAILKIVESCRKMNAPTVLAWSKPPGTSGSYEWLKARAESDRIAFNDWYPAVASVTTAIPELPILNDHSAGHYRGWVNGQIARGFRDRLIPLLKPDSLSAKTF